MTPLSFDVELRRAQLLTRRSLLGSSTVSLGAFALGNLLTREKADAAVGETKSEGLPELPHFAPKAKRVIYLFQSGGPSHVDLFDYHEAMDSLHGTDLPDSVRGGQRLTGMTSRQKSFPVVKPLWGGHRCGEHGTWISDIVPHTQSIADNITIIRSLWTEAINHDPAITFFQTGHQQPGRPSLGAWLSYGLGSESDDLPSFVVMLDKNTDPQAQPLYARLWGSTLLPSNHQGVKLRSSGDPVLYLNDPTGADQNDRRRFLDSIAAMNQLRRESVGDPEIDTRIAAYEMAYRMQTSVPELTNIKDESKETLELYGPDATIPGTHAANCLLARRLAERGVRFIQIYHRGWDHHGGLPGRHPKLAKEVDQGSAALVMDLKRRGMLKDTLVIWGGEFGRTVYRQGGNENSYGRDHHPRCFSIWMAGGGVRGGTSYGETDEWGYNIVDRDRYGVHVHDLNATILHLMGLDHEKLTYRYQGLDYRLTGVESHQPVRDILL